MVTAPWREGGTGPARDAPAAAAGIGNRQCAGPRRGSCLQRQVRERRGFRGHLALSPGSNANPAGPRHNPYLRIAFAPLNTRVIARYMSAGVPRLQAVRADDAGAIEDDDDDSPQVTLPVTRMMAACPAASPSRARDASQLHACRVPP